ncbi:MAG: alanine dehydrogenase [Cognaticolwellia sp.]|jgi:alanine dehydrogenase
MDKKIKIPKIFTEGQFGTQEERLVVRRKRNKLFIGIPKETSFQENRIALTPSSVATLTAHGHRVVIETLAGEKSNFSDHEFSEAGAEIAHDKKQVFEAIVILKVAPLTLEEVELLTPNQVIISPIHLPTLTLDFIAKLRQKRVIALAWEYVKDQSNTFPIVRTLSEMAGITAMLTAAELLSKDSKGAGILLGGISGVPPAKVVILGAGVVAETATRAALGLGAEVRVFDDNIYKLQRLQQNIGRQIYTSALNRRFLEQELYTADVVIGAIHSPEGRTPVVVSEDMVEKMKEGSVIIDVSIDQGGCFATSKVTTHDNPTFKIYDVVHYCVPNIASRVARTASLAVSNILTPMLLQAENSGSIERMIYQNEGFRHGVYTYKGSLTNYYLSQRFQLKYTNLDLLLTSNF